MSWSLTERSAPWFSIKIWPMLTIIGRPKEQRMKTSHSIDLVKRLVCLKQSQFDLTLKIRSNIFGKCHNVWICTPPKRNLNLTIKIWLIEVVSFNSITDIFIHKTQFSVSGVTGTSFSFSVQFYVIWHNSAFSPWSPFLKMVTPPLRPFLVRLQQTVDKLAEGTVPIRSLLFFCLFPKYITLETGITFSIVRLLSTVFSVGCLFMFEWFTGQC